MTTAILTEKTQIDVYALCVIRTRLRLELAGMKGHGKSTFSVVKERYGLKGSKQDIFNQFSAMVDNAKAQNGYI